MFKTNIFMENIENSRKIIAIVIILALIINIIFSIVIPKESFAAGQERQNLSDKINKYPGYAELINNLKKAHPKWNFVMFYTGLDWNQVIKNESTAWHGRNLIYSNKTGDWVCPICNDKKYDNGYWRCASEATVSYYMDPRNFLNDDYIFQFEESVYNSSSHTVDGIMKKTNGTFLAGKENAEAILQACKKVNISPYQVVSRLLLEQGDSGTILSRGNNGWYNVFNVGASGNSSSQIIANATQYAKDNGWNTLAKSIIGGIEFLKSKYIGIGQNTIYLQKFDVDSSDGILYYHQYMQNVSAAYTEGQTVRNMYKDAGVFENEISFVIPVYENMPSQRSPIPGTQSEIGNNEENGYKWDKVVLPDGKKGYVATNFLTKIDDVKNCNDKVIVNTSVNLRNGPGISNTNIITTLTEGQALTRIETGKYNNIDGYNWDRVLLLDGRQGYIVSQYIDLLNNTSNSNNNSNKELVKVITIDGLTVREQPGTDKRVLTGLSYNEVVTRTEKSVSTANGYTWDKIVTGGGVVGYIARGDSKENYIESISGNNNNVQNTTSKEENNSTSGIVNTKINNEILLKEDSKRLFTEPNTTVGKIKEKYPDAIIKNKNGKEIENSWEEKSLVGTGYTIKIKDKEYKIIKMGDIDGNGYVNSGDTLILKQKIKNIKDIKDELSIISADVNKDNVLNTGDSLIIKQNIKQQKNIKIK